MAPIPLPTASHVAPLSVESSHKSTPLLQAWVQSDRHPIAHIGKGFLLGSLIGLIIACALCFWYPCIHFYYALPGEDYHSFHMPEYRNFRLRLRPRDGFRAFARRRLRLFFMGREERTIGSRTDDEEIVDVEAGNNIQLQQGVNQGLRSESTAQQDQQPVFQGLFMFNHPTIPEPISPQTSATPEITITPPPVAAAPRPRDIAYENAENARVRQQTIDSITCPRERALQQEFESNLREIERRTEQSPATMPPIGPNSHFTPRHSMDAARPQQNQEETNDGVTFWGWLRFPRSRSE
ncbi:hypothetical protein CKAH01_11362 [Colletotrichum kahawae]|uniref:Uncharacterized protein n=1 Tax=Colletotrichum kahawae TaxID=34407 RepID=A0AAD9YX44_COLKA|nr:hypothetical protein CKAH01_11362 [Colletotrichum kahawae]